MEEGSPVFGSIVIPLRIWFDKKLVVLFYLFGSEPFYHVIVVIN